MSEINGERCVRCPDECDKDTDHPTVYLSVSKSGIIKCPYCGRVFPREYRIGNGSTVKPN